MLLIPAPVDLNTVPVSPRPTDTRIDWRGVSAEVAHNASDHHSFERPKNVRRGEFSDLAYCAEFHSVILFTIIGYFIELWPEVVG